MAYAVAADVEARLGRSLDPSETTIVNTRLADVEILIRNRIRDLDTQISTGAIDVESVIMIEAEAVLRLIRNPEGYTAETDGNYSYQISVRVASGRLDILPEEWSLLGIKSGAFSIAPKVGLCSTTCAYPWENVNRPFADFPAWDRTAHPCWCEFVTGDIKCPC